MSTDQIAKALVDRIRKGLEETGWTQKELCARAGISQMLLSNILNGKTEASIVTVVQLAQALECSVDEFFPPTKAGD